MDLSPAAIRAWAREQGIPVGDRAGRAARAPRQKEAWPALGALLARRVPVGVHIDRQLTHVDFELKRNGIVEQVPLGLEVPGGLLGSDELAQLKVPTALERARAVHDAVARVQAASKELPGSGMAFRRVITGHG